MTAPEITLRAATRQAIATLIHDEGWQRAHERLKTLAEYFMELDEWASIFRECREMIYQEREAAQKRLEEEEKKKAELPPQQINNYFLPGTAPPKISYANADQQAREAILALLADGKPHHVSCLHAIPLPYPALEAALSQLVSEEAVTDDDGMLCL